MRLLIVDDSVDSRETLAKLLRTRGYDVKTAANTGEARLVLKEQIPDVILLDLVIPWCDVRSFVEFVSREPGLSSTRIMVCTGLPGEDSLSWSRVVGLLEKPFTLEDLECELKQIERAHSPLRSR